MVDKYKELSIREVMKSLPPDEAVNAMKAKGLTSEEIKMLLEIERRELLKSADRTHNNENIVNRCR